LKTRDISWRTNKSQIILYFSKKDKCMVINMEWKIPLIELKTPYFSLSFTDLVSQKYLLNGFGLV
jgi:hypothetical protein